MPRTEGLKNSPTDVPTCEHSLVWDDSYEKILARFDRYKFRDEIGHDLVNCVEFQQLVKGYLRMHADIQE